MRRGGRVYLTGRQGPSARCHPCRHQKTYYFIWESFQNGRLRAVTVTMRNVAMRRAYVVWIVLVCIAVCMHIFIYEHRYIESSVADQERWHSSHVVKKGATENVLKHHESNQRACHPQRSIYYLKIHKTGSSTLSTILYRYARSHNITIVPINYSGVVDHGDIKSYMVAFPDHREYNIFTEHSVLNAVNVSSILPKDVAYIASVRHPFAHIKSYFMELGVGRHYSPKVDRFELFMKDIVDNGDERNIHRTKNIMLGEFGFDPLKYCTEDDMKNVFLKIWKQFDLVVVNEYFDESLLLIRRKLCLEIRDIIYTMLRVRNYARKYTIPSFKTITVHRNYSRADYILYNHAVSVIFSQIESAGEDFWNELYVYKNINKNIADFCYNHVTVRLIENSTLIYDMVRDDLSYEVSPEPWGRKFRFTAVDCAMMQLRTLTHRNILIVRQARELCSKKYHQIQDPALTKGIFVSGANVRLNLLLCKDWDETHDAPLGILAESKAYMWSANFQPH